MSAENRSEEEDGLTQLAFSRLLRWLDDGIDSHGETYLEMRRRLASYFDRRHCLSADELADHTLNRVGRTLEQAGEIAITPPARYCYVVARFVLLEDCRRRRKHVRLDDEAPVAGRSAGVRGRRFSEPEETASIAEQRLECLDRCLQTLKPDQRALVVEYYRGDGGLKIERRRELARRLGISINALAIRACRIRTTLETSLEACRKEHGPPAADGRRYASYRRQVAGTSSSDS